MRYRHLSSHTEQSYLDWIEKFVRHFNRLPGQRVQPQEMESWHARQYLRYLANERGVSATTHNVAFSAILFLFGHVLDKELDAQGVARARQSKRLPVVLTKAQCRALIAQLSGTQHLVVSLL